MQGKQRASWRCLHPHRDDASDKHSNDNAKSKNEQHLLAYRTQGRGVLEQVTHMSSIRIIIRLALLGCLSYT